MSGFSVLLPLPKTFLWGQGTCLGHQTLQAFPASWGTKPGGKGSHATALGSGSLGALIEGFRSRSQCWEGGLAP